MQAINEIGCSEYSRLKWARFRLFLEGHIRRIQWGFKRAWTGPPDSNYYYAGAQQSYYYVDLYAGPGYYGPEHGEVAGEVGSPIIAIRCLSALRMRHQVWFGDPNEHETLRQSLITDGHPDLAKSVYGRCCSLSVDMLLNFRTPRKMFGLVFVDPNGAPDWEALRRLAHSPQWRHMDFLININAVAHKRRRGRFAGDVNKRPSEHLVSLGKPFIYLSDPNPSGFENIPNSHQFVLAYCTSAHVPSCYMDGFYRMNKSKGRQIECLIDYTKEEREELDLIPDSLARAFAENSLA